MSKIEIPLQVKPQPPETRASREWLPAKRWNPFNSYKLLAQVERWSRIQRGAAVPAPALITVDPSNSCNHDCVWCNAAAIREERSRKLSEKVLVELAAYLPRWGEGQPGWPPGVGAVCVAGGGEPLSNRATPVFIEHAAAQGVEVGVVTNGSYISRCPEALALSTWVGVSVDAGSADTFNRLKNLPKNSDAFDHIVDNIANLVELARSRKARLAAPLPAYGVSYKYLLYPENIGEVYQAARLAKEIGCKNIHFRPAGTTWDNLGSAREILFSPDEVALFEEQVALAMELDDDSFSVYGVTHKFNDQFSRANDFSSCHAVFMTSVVMPPATEESPEDSFVLGLCCDRRGDPRLELGRDLTSVEEIGRLWGSPEHWQIHDRIRVGQDCPRCTYQPHNQIYEQVIQNDSMTYRFI